MSNVHNTVRAQHFFVKHCEAVQVYQVGAFTVTVVTTKTKTFVRVFDTIDFDTKCYQINKVTDCFYVGSQLVTYSKWKTQLPEVKQIA